MLFAADNLDDYSRAAAERILERFPDWESFASVRHPTDYQQSFVDFEFPCPSSSVECGLWLSTADGEITVGFHTHHSHFTDYQQDEFDPTHVDAALEYAASIQREQTVIISWYSGEVWAGSATANSTDSFPPMSEALPTTHANRITRRSWHGTFDTESPLS